MGLELAGKMALMPIEFAQEKDLATMRGDIDYRKPMRLADRSVSRSWRTN